MHADAEEEAEPRDDLRLFRVLLRLCGKLLLISVVAAWWWWRCVRRASCRVREEFRVVHHACSRRAWTHADRFRPPARRRSLVAPSLLRAYVRPSSPCRPPAVVFVYCRPRSLARCCTYRACVLHDGGGAGGTHHARAGRARSTKWGRIVHTTLGEEAGRFH